MQTSFVIRAGPALVSISLLIANEITHLQPVGILHYIITYASYLDAKNDLVFVLIFNFQKIARYLVILS